MKRNLWYLTLVAIAGLATAHLTGGAGLAQDTPAAGLGGTWKLVVLAFGDDEFAVVKLDIKAGKISGTTAATQERLFGPSAGVKLDPLKSEGESLTMGLTGPAGVNLFHGKLVKDGPNAGKILGNFSFRGDVYPARLEPTKSESVAEMKQGSLIPSYVKVMQERDFKSKVRQAREAIDKNAGNPTTHLFYGELLGAAEAGGLTATEVAAIVDRWVSEAEPYGAEWSNTVRLKALKALSNSKPYATQTLKLAQKAEQLLAADASVEVKAGIAGMVARTAALAGENAVATEAQARAAKLEAQIDEEYHKKVPPFTPVKYAGRKNTKANRVVLMELFTGAQCPPCVAADVGFDALFKTYSPQEVIGLQYHLHIPDQDPLTNAASRGRQAYYDDQIGGTPATFFNGESLAGGGGPMQLSEGKYNEFRRIIDDRLESTQDAAIQLTAALRGDQIEIQAQATVDRKSPLAKPSADSSENQAEGKKKAEETPHSKPRLRLAITEEAVRYVGGNRLRFHHHVVRAFPGGVEGKDLSSGSGQVNLKVNLADLKQELQKANSDDAKKRPFPNALPEIDLKDLSVVAFVQDDADKAVLQAVSVPVK